MMTIKRLGVALCSIALNSFVLLATPTSYATDITLQQVQQGPVQTQDAQLRININPQQTLAPGAYTFELVAIDDSGNQSAPARTRVVVRDNAKPTAVISAPQAVDVGQPIVLDGSKSSDIGGKVTTYVWRLVAN